MPTRSSRGGEEGSSPVVRSDDVKGTGIGPNRTCSPGTSDCDREGEVVIIVGSTKPDKGRSGSLFEGVGGEIRPLESAGVVHDGVEGVRGGMPSLVLLIPYHVPCCVFSAMLLFVLVLPY
jgi:hypothetical protein